jgi:hypothetical protein
MLLVRTADTRRWVLLAAGGFGFAAFFVVVVLFDRPGLGLGRFLFLPVVLFALATDAWLGALGGVFATALYIAAVFINPRIPESSIVTTSMLVRFVSFVAVGVLIATSRRSIATSSAACGRSPSATSSPDFRAVERSSRR